MSYLTDLGYLALGSRLRRLNDRLAREGTQVYDTLGIHFEIRWFPVFHLLGQRGPSAVMEIADTLELTHPAIIEIADKLSDRGLLTSRKDDKDRRRRLLALTPKGKRLTEQLQPVWRAFERCGREVARGGGNDLLEAIESVEAALDRLPLHDRIVDRLQPKRVRTQK